MIVWQILSPSSEDHANVAGMRRRCEYEHDHNLNCTGSGSTGGAQFRKIWPDNKLAVDGIVWITKYVSSLDEKSWNTSHESDKLATEIFSAQVVELFLFFILSFILSLNAEVTTLKKKMHEFSQYLFVVTSIYRELSNLGIQTEK